MLRDSSEFSPFQMAPLGVPGNPLEGTPGDAENMREGAKRQRRLWAKGERAPLATPNRLESSGLTGVGGVPGATQLPQSPEQLLVPDVVSATDPAFSAHPVVQGYLKGLSRTPSASSLDSRDALPSAWMQYRSGQKPLQLKKATLLNALNMNTKGMDLPYSDQGASLGRAGT